MKKIPPSLQIIVTSNCNFKCKTCFGGFRRGDNLPISLLEKALDEAPKLGYKIITLTGGEPALHPQFPEIIKYIVKKGLLFNFISNGSLIEKYQFIVEKYRANFDTAVFSIDGADAKINDYIRQPGSFKKVISAVKYFLSLDIPTVVEVCLNAINKDQINDMIMLFRKIGIKTVVFSSAVQTPLNKKIILSDKEKRICLKEIFRLRKKYKEIEILTRNSLQGIDGIDFCPGLNSLSTLTINPRGDLLYCSVTRFDGMSLGSLKNHSLYSLINKYRKMVRHLKDIRKQMIRSGRVINGFNTCEFCDYFLKEYFQNI